jgi:hypothetical protein
MNPLENLPFPTATLKMISAVVVGPSGAGKSLLLRMLCEGTKLKEMETLHTDEELTKKQQQQETYEPTLEPISYVWEEPCDIDEALDGKITEPATEEEGTLTTAHSESEFVPPPSAASAMARYRVVEKRARGPVGRRFWFREIGGDPSLERVRLRQQPTENLIVVINGYSPETSLLAEKYTEGIGFKTAHRILLALDDGAVEMLPLYPLPAAFDEGYLLSPRSRDQLLLVMKRVMWRTANPSPRHHTRSEGLSTTSDGGSSSPLAQSSDGHCTIS